MSNYWRIHSLYAKRALISQFRPFVPSCFKYRADFANNCHERHAHHKAMKMSRLGSDTVEVEL